MRCRACNKVLEDHEITEHPSLVSELEDLCIPCKHVAYGSLLDQVDEELEAITKEIQELVDSNK